MSRHAHANAGNRPAKLRLTGISDERRAIGGRFQTQDAIAVQNATSARTINHQTQALRSLRIHHLQRARVERDNEIGEEGH